MNTFSWFIGLPLFVLFWVCGLWPGVWLIGTLLFLSQLIAINAGLRQKAAVRDYGRLIDAQMRQQAEYNADAIARRAS